MSMGKVEQNSIPCSHVHSNVDTASSLLFFSSVETNSHLEKICFLTFPVSLTVLSNLISWSNNPLLPQLNDNDKK